MTRHFPGVALLLLSVAVGPLHAAQPLFPKPMHLVREIDDSLTGHVTRVDEYYAGDRAVTVRGDHTVIADYGKQELTEIDRGRATYSIAPFARIAAALPSSAKVSGQSAATAPTISRKGRDQRAGRSVDLYTADDAGAGLHAEVAIDPSMVLTKDAFDVVSGAAFPKSGGPAGAILRGTAAHRLLANNGTSAETVQTYALPIEQRFRWDAQGQGVVVSNRVLSVDEQLPPPDLVAIPPGARQIESRTLEAQRVAADSDALVPQH